MGGWMRGGAEPLCSALDHVDVFNFRISLLIVAGLVASYLPQHYRIVRRGTSDGISSFYLFLGVTSCTNAFLNVLILQTDVLGCCWDIPLVPCFAASLGVIQVGLQLVMFTITMVLSMVFFARPYYFPESSDTNEVPVPVYVPRSSMREWRQAVVIAVLCGAHFISFTAVSAYYMYTGKTRSEGKVWADWLGGSAMILAAIQYLPQIHETLKHQHQGSLSMLTMMIQTPGSFVFAYSLWRRKDTKWSSWIMFVVTGSLQGFLLCLCLWYSYRESRLRKQPLVSAYSVDDDNEQQVDLLESITGRD